MCSLIQLGSELSLPPRREDAIAAVANSSQPFRSPLSPILPRAPKTELCLFSREPGKLSFPNRNFVGRDPTGWKAAGAAVRDKGAKVRVSDVDRGGSRRDERPRDQTRDGVLPGHHQQQPRGRGRGGEQGLFRPPSTAAPDRPQPKAYAQEQRAEERVVQIPVQADVRGGPREGKVSGKVQAA